jgi:hypothetical protein
MSACATCEHGYGLQFAQVLDYFQIYYGLMLRVNFHDRT